MRHETTRDARRAALAVLLLLCWCASDARARQQGAAPAKDAPASITGRVTREQDDKSVPGVIVTLTTSDPNSNFKIVARATTDAEGRYRLANVVPGRYQLTPLALAYAVKDAGWTGWPPGRPVTLTPGEELDGADFRLARGGVITGRVTDADGKPVVAERVNVTRLDKKQLPGIWYGGTMYMTDDRGVYRVYGLHAGQYHVSIGQDKSDGMIRVGGPNRYFQRTYHPATTDETQARVVEVGPGDETKDVDIVVARAAKTFKASGRIVSAETGQPVADVMFAHGSLGQEQKRIGAWGLTGARTNSRGEFTVENLSPGRYAVFASRMVEKADWYSDAVAFEIEDADVSGLEVKIRRGATLSGVAQFEGLNDPAARAQLLAQVLLLLNGGPRDELVAPGGEDGKVNADGTFRFEGLRPGKYQLTLANWRTPKGVSLLRVEAGGVDARDGIEVGEGARVAGVRVLLGYGTGVVRGQVNTAAGAPFAPPQGVRAVVVARRVVGGQAERNVVSSSPVDARGRFTLEGMPAGDYLVVLNFKPPGAAEPIDARQRVTLNEGGEASVVLVIK